MDYGIAFANTGPFADAAGVTTLASAAEAAGFESVWTVEHVVYPSKYESAYPYDDSGRMMMAPDTPLPDPLIWLTWVAAATTTLNLATGILILPQRNPAILAKTLGTLDSLSGGRVRLGVGVGWLHEEFDALGIPWERRGARTDEYIEAMRVLWSGDEVSFTGDFVDFEAVSCNPKPLSGTVPIIVGGHSRAAAERAGRLGDGFWPGKGDIAELVDIMQQAAAAADRDPNAIEVTFGSEGVFGDDPVGAAQELAAAGVSRLIAPAFLYWRDPASTMAEFGERVIAPTTDI